MIFTFHGTPAAKGQGLYDIVRSNSENLKKETESGVKPKIRNFPIFSVTPK